jgi:hypothetical protein
MSNMARGGMRTTIVRNAEDHEHKSPAIAHANTGHGGGTRTPIGTGSKWSTTGHFTNTGGTGGTQHNPPGGGHGTGKPPGHTGTGGGKHNGGGGNKHNGGGGNKKHKPTHGSGAKHLKHDRGLIRSLRQQLAAANGSTGFGDPGGGGLGGPVVVPPVDGSTGAGAATAPGPNITLVFGAMTVLGVIAYLLWHWYEAKHGKGAAGAATGKGGHSGGLRSAIKKDAGRADRAIKKVA